MCQHLYDFSKMTKTGTTAPSHGLPWLKFPQVISHSVSICFWLLVCLWVLSPDTGARRPCNWWLRQKKHQIPQASLCITHPAPLFSRVFVYPFTVDVEVEVMSKLSGMLQKALPVRKQLLPNSKTEMQTNMAKFALPVFQVVKEIPGHFADIKQTCWSCMTPFLKHLAK